MDLSTIRTALHRCTVGVVDWFDHVSDAVKGSTNSADWKRIAAKALAHGCGLLAGIKTLASDPDAQLSIGLPVLFAIITGTLEYLRRKRQDRLPDLVVVQVPATTPLPPSPPIPNQAGPAKS